MSNSDSRRKLLKSIAAGSGAVVAGKSLPESWSKPIVDSVLLPAHAETTDSDSAPTTLCVTGPMTITHEDDPESIAIIFDGDTCSLAGFDDNNCEGACVPDTMLLLDFDVNEKFQRADFDLISPYGSNWGAGPNKDDLPAGTYTFTNTRMGGANSGNSYAVTFTVSFTNIVFNDGEEGNTGEMMVSDVSFEAV